MSGFVLVVSLERILRMNCAMLKTRRNMMNWIERYVKRDSSGFLCKYTTKMDMHTFRVHDCILYISVQSADSTIDSHLDNSYMSIESVWYQLRRIPSIWSLPTTPTTVVGGGAEET